MFVHPDTLILVNVELDKRDQWMEKLTEVYDRYTRDRAIISFLPVSYITGANNAFYKWVVEANNTRLHYEICRVIDLNARA